MTVPILLQLTMLRPPLQPTADTAAAAIDAATAGAQNAAVVPAASVPLRHSWLRRKEGRPRRRRREGRCPR
jgi:hypothetical protein